MLPYGGGDQRCRFTEFGGYVEVVKESHCGRGDHRQLAAKALSRTGGLRSDTLILGGPLCNSKTLDFPYVHFSSKLHTISIFSVG